MADWAARLQDALAQPMGESSDFDLNPGTVLTAGRVLRPAAVLVAVWGDRLVLTKRASHLKHHPGQIAFPGGKVDEGDASPEDTALREAEEETGLDRRSVSVWGRLALHETVTGFTVTPVLGEITGPFTPRPERGEVDEVFCPPLSHVLDPANYLIEGRHWRGQWRRYYVVPWGPYYIWGATARMLRGLAARVRP
jgi:8-oxo-dGTP pyrophosphatase MutT (NUDIX family)